MKIQHAACWPLNISNTYIEHLHRVQTRTLHSDQIIRFAKKKENFKLICLELFKIINQGFMRARERERECVCVCVAVKKD
jgi:hypothetical protein